MEDLERLLALCDQLSTTVTLGPGLHNAIFAMSDARETLDTLRLKIPAIDIQNGLVEIEASFERWFTPSDWRGHDQGQSFQQDLYTKILRLKTGIRLWHSAQMSPTHRENPERS